MTEIPHEKPIIDFKKLRDEIIDRSEKLENEGVSVRGLMMNPVTLRDALSHEFNEQLKQKTLYGTPKIVQKIYDGRFGLYGSTQIKEYEYHFVVD